MRWQHWVCTSCCARGSQVELLWHSLLLLLLSLREGEPGSVALAFLVVVTASPFLLPSSSSSSSSSSWFFSPQPVRGLQLFGWGRSHPLYWACQVWLLALASFTSRLFHHHKPSTQQHHRHPRLEQGDHRKCGNTSICDAPTPRRGLCLHQVRTRGLQHTKFTSTICIIVWPGYEERYWESDWMWSKGSFS